MGLTTIVKRFACAALGTLLILSAWPGRTLAEGRDRHDTAAPRHHTRLHQDEGKQVNALW